MTVTKFYGQIQLPGVLQKGITFLKDFSHKM
mgnify:CR=1 FL=1